MTHQGTRRTPQRRRDQPPPRTGSSEKDVLTGFLTYLRGAVVPKVTGVDDDRLRAPGVPSGTNLLGLVKHLAHVERSVFLGETVRSWPATFTVNADETTEAVVAAYVDAVARADDVIEAAADLGEPLRASGPSLRWALAHMIEETGRHAGHLDILREQVDGRTGR